MIASEGSGADHAVTWATLVKDAASEDAVGLANLLAGGTRPKAEDDEEEARRRLAAAAAMSGTRSPGTPKAKAKLDE